MLNLYQIKKTKTSRQQWQWWSWLWPTIPDPIEQPEGNKEEGEKEGDQASEQMDSRQRSSWTPKNKKNQNPARLVLILIVSPVEDCPGADGEDEKFEREGDEKAVTLNLTTIDFVQLCPKKITIYLKKKGYMFFHLTLQLGGSEAKEGHSGDEHIIINLSNTTITNFTIITDYRPKH